MTDLNYSRSTIFWFIEEYHSQLHNEQDIEMEEHDGDFQPVSDLKMMRLGRIIKDLRAQVPVSAEAPGEKIVIPDTDEVRIHSCIMDDS